MVNSLAQLWVRDVSKQFKQGDALIHVLKDVSLDFKQGNTYAITGASGTGKSTLLHLLAGLDVPTHGAIFFNNTNIALLLDENRAQFLNRSIGLVFQAAYLIRELTVLENIMLKGMICGMTDEVCREKAHFLLETIGLSHKAHEYPGSLSGGQQQRVAIARALLSEPAFLLADEPTGNLDEKTAHELFDFLVECQERWGMGIIVSTHDKEIANRMETIFHIHEGVATQEK